MTRVALVPTIKVVPGRMEDFLARVAVQRDDCLTNEPGCQHFDVLVVGSLPDTVLLYEIYENADAVTLHREMPHYKSFKADTADMVANMDVVLWDIV